jgi:hypothetical protein
MAVQIIDLLFVNSTAIAYYELHKWLRGGDDYKLLLATDA